MKKVSVKKQKRNHKCFKLENDKAKGKPEGEVRAGRKSIVNPLAANVLHVIEIFRKSIKFATKLYTKLCKYLSQSPVMVFQFSLHLRKREFLKRSLKLKGFKSLLIVPERINHL